MTSKQRHENTKKQFLKLKGDLEDIRDKYLEQISTLINKAIKKYADNDMWEEFYNEIIDIFYNALSEAYLKTSIALKNIYQNISDDIPNIDDLVYHEDNKTLPQRVKGYWDEVLELLKDEQDNTLIALYLLNMYDRILSNEIINVSTGVKKVKRPVPPNGCIEVIIITDGECCDHGGLYLASDGVDEPPYHIGCQCMSWSEYYDPEDPFDLMVLEELGWEEDDE